MRHWCDIDVDVGCVFVKRTGDYDFEVWMAVAKAILDDPRIKKGMCRIIDLRDTNSGPTRHQVHRMAAIYGSIDDKLGPLKTAIIAPSPSVFGMNRMYQTYRANTAADIHVWKSFDDARNWLDLPSGYADPFPLMEAMLEVGKGT
jgi:hypothetical protein